MLNNLLVMGEITFFDALIYALIGFAFVFIGIGVLIGILYLVGFIMQKTGGKVKLPNPFKKKAKEEVKTQETTVIPSTETEEVPNEIKAAIMAALMAYYSAEKPKCDFVVRNIKRI
ncbi:MAG: OadG family protein [Clostridia bacterium]|nr:OadG family protein [Clostridia bacterium]